MVLKLMLVPGSKSTRMKEIEQGWMTTADGYGVVGNVYQEGFLVGFLVASGKMGRAPTAH